MKITSDSLKLKLLRMKLGFLQSLLLSIGQKHTNTMQQIHHLLTQIYPKPIKKD